MSEEEVKAALRTVEDPEAGMSVLDLGLVYGIALEPGKVRVDMTMTSPACPASEYIVDEAAAAIRAQARVWRVLQLRVGGRVSTRHRSPWLRRRVPKQPLHAHQPVGIDFDQT